MSARAKGWIYVVLFLLALGVGVPFFVALESEDGLLALSVVALPVIGGGAIYAIYACIQAYRAVWKVVSPRAGTDPEEPAPQRASFLPEYARKFGERSAQRIANPRPETDPRVDGQHGIESDER